ncbi:hypothetical protein DLAC_05935 [Tieghemostelium lacteum]|uniref:VTT domain-containing protein n=1 Tax=Tieghemostelium lacteum TaxID=361077 RepID=A0A151ZH33_TIELA|nr:hypothetical protein DLAC_05935 [Tieghemostelium lacteum]|eukprot:KYQ93276.1 hypothetical protein DLAC_05935 [Tieghemostelium lacteum]
MLVPNSPIQIVTLRFMKWISDIPEGWGVVLVTLIYAISLVFCFPGTPINLAAGFLFGPVIGSISTVLGCDLGAIFSFIISRTLTREWAEQKMKSNKTYSQIDIAVAKNGFLIIFLLRLSPVIPFGICNYLFGATKITFSKYWLATTAGLIPCTVAYTYMGSLMRSLTDIYSGDNANTDENSNELMFISLATIFTALIIVVITIVTKRTLKSAMESQELNEQMDLEKGFDLPFLEEEQTHSSSSDQELPSSLSMDEIFTEDASSVSNLSISSKSSFADKLQSVLTQGIKKTNLKNDYKILESEDNSISIDTIK